MEMNLNDYIHELEKVRMQHGGELPVKILNVEKDLWETGVTKIVTIAVPNKISVLMVE